MLPPTIPLFPLPNVVLFPNVHLPRHVFEPEVVVVMQIEQGAVEVEQQSVELVPSDHRCKVECADLKWGGIIPGFVYRGSGDGACQKG